MVGVYCRVSTEKQVAEGFSLATQRQKGIRFAQRLGEPHRVFEDGGISGGTFEREQFRLLLDEIREGRIKKVWVISKDRLTRASLEEAISLRNHFIKHQVELFIDGVLNPLSSPEGLLQSNIQDSIAEYQKLLIQKKTREGKAAERNAGRRAYSSLYGYSQVIEGVKANGKPDRRWPIDQSKADIVRLIYRLNVEEKLGLAEICKRLNGMGFKSEQDKNFEPSAVSRILKHIEYTGKSINIDGQIIDSKIYEPIIDFQTWEAAQNSYKPTITNNSKRGRRASHAMTNIIKCAYCGAGFFYHYGAAPYKWRNSDKITIRHRHVYYHRHTVPCVNERKSFSMEILDAIGLIVYRRAMTYQSEDILKRAMAEMRMQIDEGFTKIENLKKAIAKVEKDIARVMKLYLDDESLEEVVAPTLQEKNGEKANLITQLAKAEEQVGQNQRSFDAVLAEFSIDKVQAYLRATPKARLEMLRAIIKKATNKDGDLAFELIDGRVYRIEYYDFQSEFKVIHRQAQERAEKEPSRALWENRLAAKIGELDEGWAMRNVSESVVTPRGEGSELWLSARSLRAKSKDKTVGVWEREYFIIAAVLAKLDAATPPA